MSAADADALEAEHERLLVYRELVRGTLREALEASIPRSIARLGALFDEYFERFLRERGPQTHYLRDVTPEFLELVEPLWRADARVAPYLAELCQHESLQIQVSAEPERRRPETQEPLALDRAVALTAALRLVQYEYAVHELSADMDARDEPARRSVALLAYRSPDHDVRYLELSPLAHGIVRHLLDGRALGLAMQAAASEQGSLLDETLLSGAAQLLSDLAERGVLWGSLAAEATESALESDTQLG